MMMKFSRIPILRKDDIEPVAEIILIENLWMCDCEVVDGNTMEQFTEWDNQRQVPFAGEVLLPV